MGGDVSTAQLTAIIAVVVAVSLAYGKAFGATQCQIVEWFVQGFRIPSRWKGLLNLVIGVALAALVALFAAVKTGEWSIVGVGALAGVLASVEAARVHDDAKSDPDAARPPPG